MCQSNQITVNIHRLSERAPFYETPERFLPCGKGYGILRMSCFPETFNVTLKGSNTGKGLMWYWLGRLGWAFLGLCFAFLWTDEQREGSELEALCLKLYRGEQTVDCPQQWVVPEVLVWSRLILKKKKKPPCLSHVFNFDLDSCLCLNFIFLTGSLYHEEEGMAEAH